MMYRAKVTNILDFCNQKYKNANYVKDAKDVYIEVNDLDVADYLEELNAMS